MVSDPRLVTSSKTVSVLECKIIGSNGQIKDLKTPLIFNNIQIYESIYSPVITGTIQLIEGVNLYSLLSMHGNEYLYISFSRSNQDSAEVRYSRTFRIYKSDLRQPTGLTQTQTYVLHFCSDELVFGAQQTISRALNGLSTSEHVFNILLRDLKVNRKRIKTIERSQGTRDFILTKYKPFEAIDRLTKYSYNENGSPFLFFENRDGYNFISLEKLFSQDPIEPALNYSTAKSTFEVEESPFKNSNELKKFNFEQSFNVLDGVESGAFATRLYTLDLVRQKYSKYDYSLINEQSQRTMLDGYFPLNTAKNRNGRPIYQEHNAKPNYWLTNLNQNETPYAISKAFRSINNDVEKVLMQRQVHLNLLNNTRVWCNIPGNPNYSVGYVVTFNLPSFIPNNTERAIDPYHSGKYLITSVRHSITPDDIETVMTLNKNSVAVPYDSAVASPEYARAREY